MDYVEAMETVTKTIGDMRRRLISVEAALDVAGRDNSRLEELETRLERLLSRVEEVEDIDIDDKIRDAFRDASFTVTID